MISIKNFRKKDYIIFFIVGIILFACMIGFFAYPGADLIPLVILGVILSFIDSLILGTITNFLIKK